MHLVLLCVRKECVGKHAVEERRGGVDDDRFQLPEDAALDELTSRIKSFIVAAISAEVQEDPCVQSEYYVSWIASPHAQKRPKF